MDPTPDPKPATGGTGPIELIVSYGHRLKPRVTSKNKLNNAITTNADHDKKRSISKLPRVRKTPQPSYSSFSGCGPSENSESITMRSSKPKFESLKSKNSRELEKLKGSHIPRRKIVPNTVRKDNVKKQANRNYFANESQRVQRLHLQSTNPDFNEDDHGLTASIGSTRPIPTLGQIYRRNNIIIDGERFYDWFMELDTPVNSLESNPMNTQQRKMESCDSTDTAQSVINFETTKPYFSNREKSNLVFGANVYKTTNDNVTDWLTTEVDYSNKDNESGYRSMSPHSRGTINIEPKYSDDAIAKHSMENYCLALGKTSERSETEREEDTAEVNNTDMPLVEQSTVVISRLDEDSEMDPTHSAYINKKVDIALEPMPISKSANKPLIEQATVVISKLNEETGTESFQSEYVKKIDVCVGPIVVCKSEHGKNIQFPSIIARDSKEGKQAIAPSYVDCPSEILQKTTNFERDGCDSPKTLSSIAGTDLEIRDDYSSLYALENVDDCNLEDHHGNSTWCPSCRSQSCMTFVNSGDTENTFVQKSFCGCHGDKLDRTITSVLESVPGVRREWRNYCPACGRRASRPRHGDSETYCKHSRYRRFPSNRYKLPKPLDSLRKKLSISRICRHRWNHVWKKTAAKWANRSKSHAKLGKYRMLQYLQSSVIWEDVDVQTMLLLYRETGTHTVMEQRSAGISTSTKVTSAKKTDTGGIASSVRSLKSRFKQINLGPSRFPFFYNSRRRSMPVQKHGESSKPVQKYKSYPEHQNNSFEALGSKKTFVHRMTSSKDTSMVWGRITENALTSPINVYRSGNCPCIIRPRKSSSVKIKRSKRKVCPCPVAISDDSFQNMHKLKTVDTETDDSLLYRVPYDEKRTNTLFSTREYDRANVVGIQKCGDACTQAFLSTNNMGTITSFAPVYHKSFEGQDSRNIPIYKPCGRSSVTESVKVGTMLKEVDLLTNSTQSETTGNDSFQTRSALKEEEHSQNSCNDMDSIPSYKLKDKPSPNDPKLNDSVKTGLVMTDDEQNSSRFKVTGSSINQSKSTAKKSVSLKLPMSGNSSKKDTIKKIAQTRLTTTGSTNTINTDSVIKRSPSSKLESSNKMIPDTKVVQSNVSMTESANKNNLAAESLKPRLTSTDTNITSISSAQMLATDVIKSQLDNCLAAGYQTYHVDVSTSCQCGSAKTTSCLLYRECNDASTGQSQIKVNRSTYSPVPVSEDKSIGQSFSDNKQYREFSTQALIDQWCQPESVIIPEKASVAESTKSKFVYVATNLKSAYTVISKKKTRSADMVTSDESVEVNSVSESTNTHNTASIGIGLPSSIIASRRPNKTSTIDTWAQCSNVYEHGEKYSLRSARIGLSKLLTTRRLNDSNLYDTETEPIIYPSSHYKSIAVMTSGPFDQASNTFCDKDSRLGMCTCGQIGFNVETNTPLDLKTEQHKQCSTQIFQSQCNPNMDKGTSSYEESVLSQTLQARNVNSSAKRTAANQLTSLSRLIGQVRSGPQIAAESAPAITSTILSSNLDAEKWIKRCTNNDEKDYQSLLDREQSTLETLKQASMSIANSNKSAKILPKKSLIGSIIKANALCSLTSAVEKVPSPIRTISEDSLADVLPVPTLTKETVPSKEIKKMADKVTSDEPLSKPLKESILQTCPDICDTGTDAIPQIGHSKSASALTSRCILIPPTTCFQHNQNSADCIFIYDKPRCAVHNKSLNASVQNIAVEKSGTNNTDKYPKILKREHAIDRMDNTGTHPRHTPFEKKSTVNSMIGEVLSPKVYKSLYETTKMLAKNTSSLPIENEMESENDIEKEAAIIRALAIRSAAILTSSHENCRCNKLTADSAAERAEYVFAYDTPRASPEGSTQTCSTCHARLLEIPSYYHKGVAEEQMKTHLVGSCRYFSSLLSKRLGRVKDKVAKHIAPSTEQCLYFATYPKLSYAEACTMKPSGREDLGCQTGRKCSSLHKSDLSKNLSYCVMSPSLTNICDGDEKHYLKSVYYMLSAIEGRLRRLKRNMPN